MANQPRKVETDTLPQRQGYTMFRGRDVARSNARTATPASETTTLPPGEERCRTEAPCRETSRSKQKGKLPGEQPASQPSEENPARHCAGERQHPPVRRSRPNPRRGRTATGREEEGPRPTSPLVRVPQSQDPPEARTVKCGTYIATEQNGPPKEGTKPPRGKAGPLARAQL